MTGRIERDRVLWETIDGETLLIDTESGHYFSLDAIGGAIWSMLTEGRAEDEIAAALCRDYDVDGFTARRDVRALVARLEEERLLVKPREETRAGAGGER